MNTPQLGALRLDMSMSLDGYITGPDDVAGQGLGAGGEPLHGWLGDGGVDPTTYRPAERGVNQQVFDEILGTGAVVTGRRTFDLAGHWDGDHHDGVPVFVLTRTEPAEPAPGHCRYVTDVAECVRLAKEAAGGRDVMMHGASAARAVLAAGLLDEIELHLVPLVLGDGRRLFDGLSPEQVGLEMVRCLEGPGVVHLRYQVRRPGSAD